MTELRRVLLILFCFPFLSYSNLEMASTSDPSLVAYYSFNQCDARDDSGNGSDGRLMGGVSCWCGIDEDGLLFDGQNDYLEFSGLVNNYFNTSDFTVSFYFRVERKSIFRESLISKRSTCTDEHTLDIQLDLSHAEIRTEVIEKEGKDYGDISPEIESMGWHHFALVREGTKAYTYINGELIRTGRRCSGVDISNDTPLSFSNSTCVGRGGARRFKGVLDELRIYDRALEPEEIEALYDLYPVENAASDCFT